MNLADQIGLVVGFVLTLMVVSYLLGDNALFRLAVHVFIGVAAGYAAVLVIYNVLWYQVLVPLIQSPMASLAMTAPPLLLGVWLLLKASPRLSGLGNPVLAFLVGVGAASAIGGSVLGTLFPQVSGTINLFDLGAVQANGAELLSWVANALIILLGTAVTLVYFQFGVGGRPGQPGRFQALLDALGMMGKGFIAVTFGVLFAGVYLTALTALVGRVYFVWNALWQWIGMF